MKLVAAFSKSWFVVAVLCLVHAHLAVGQSNALGDNGGVIRFDRTLGPGYDMCGAEDWKMVRELLDHFAPRMVVAEPRDLRAVSCKMCGKLCFYSGSGCPHRPTMRRLEENKNPGDQGDGMDLNALQPTKLSERTTSSALEECKPNCAEDDRCCKLSCEVAEKVKDLEAKTKDARCKAWVASGAFWCNKSTQE